MQELFSYHCYEIEFYEMWINTFNTDQKNNAQIKKTTL